jgi:apolipoprotein N-acyltransferase
MHYGFGYLVPFGILGIGLVYGVLFWVCGLFHESPWIKGILFFGLSFVAPFGFNWLDLRLLLLQTPFSSSYTALAFFILGTLCLFTCKGKWRFVAIIPFVFALEGTRPEPAQLHPAPQLIQTNISQSDKWQRENKDAQIQAVREAIIAAVAEDEAVIVFPESVFPLFLNHQPALLEELKTFSHGIEIIAGALSGTEEGVYNSAYHFKAGKAHVSHKVILVPFGEAVPLPAFLKDFVNAFFYGGANDFLVANEPNDFLVHGTRVRSAICFEATRPELYENSPGIMIALSNNAWFTPSIEPTLQRLLLKLYATQFNTTIYHSTNGSPSEVILPKQSGPLAPVLLWVQKRFELLFNI